MELKDELRSQFNRCHRLAKKHYNDGHIANARVEYLKCVELLKHLAQISSPQQKETLLKRAQSFSEIADGLQKGTIKVYTDGLMPAKKDTRSRDTEEQQQRESKSFLLTQKPNLRFADIAGLEPVKENIQEAIVYPFKYPEEYKYFGVKPGGGILLYGPPGCGKTMLAAAAAAECDASFISLKISDIKDKYVGESEKNIKEIFETAQDLDRAILFFDEIDSLAGERSGSREGHERSLVSELLAQMDGLEAKGVERKYLVLAATNRPWDVDIALRRPGRFDTTVFVPAPDLEARKKLFELNLKDKPFSPSLNIGNLAEKTDGYTSAEIVAVCQLAARIPLREKIREKKPRRQLAVTDFEKVMKKQKGILGAWYTRAVTELSNSEQMDMFAELIDAARQFSNHMNKNTA